jgi:hypothetical protein
MKPKSKPDDPEQSKEFIRIARELGADGPPEAADNLMGTLAKKPPEPHQPYQRRGKPGSN